MRLWSIHPEYLDAKGLVALWREGLLAQKVLLGETRGYRNHPQLIRFIETGNACGAIARYLRLVADEADRRGYCFDRRKIIRRQYRGLVTVTGGQVQYEWQHLLSRLQSRDPGRYRMLEECDRIRVHPLFRKVRGKIADWERVR